MYVYNGVIAGARETGWVFAPRERRGESGVTCACNMRPCIGPLRVVIPLAARNVLL